MLLLITIMTLLVLPFLYVLVVTVSFNNQVEKAGKVDNELAKSFKVKMMVSGIVLGIPFGIFFFDLQGLTAAVQMMIFWSLIFSLGFVQVAARAISRLKRKYQQNQ